MSKLQKLQVFIDDYIQTNTTVSIRLKCIIDDEEKTFIQEISKTGNENRKPEWFARQVFKMKKQEIKDWVRELENTGSSLVGKQLQFTIQELNED